MARSAARDRMKGFLNARPQREWEGGEDNNALGEILLESDAYRELDPGRSFTIYACTEEGCTYYRDALSSGKHAAENPDDPMGPYVYHEIAPLKVVAVKEER